MCTMHVRLACRPVVVVCCAGLRKKTVAPGASGLDEHLRSPASTDLFGTSDAIVKHVLEVGGEGREGVGEVGGVGEGGGGEGVRED